MQGPEIITLGCRLNIAESEAMRTLAMDREDLVIVNSCAVTAAAVKQTRQAIRRARRARPDAQLIVTGCAAQTEPESFARMAEVDLVLGNREKLDSRHFKNHSESGNDNWDAKNAEIHVSDIMAVRETTPHMAAAFAEHARAFVEVQNGCDHRCTFCVIPYGRGNSRSVPAGLVIDRIKALVDEGYQEIVLTGVDVTSYGPDLPGNPSLGMLVERVLRYIPGLPRLRLSSLDSVEIDDRLFDLVTGDIRVMPHLHLSLQAGDDMILKRMKRRHSRADAIRIVERLKAKRPEIAIGADIIAGFPTENETMFANSLALIEEADVVHGHIFPYSPRAGTPAARMPQVDLKVIRERAARLRATCEARKAAWLRSLVGTKQKVLIELDGVTGHAENFASVHLQCHSRQRGNGKTGIQNIHITAATSDALAGMPA